MALPINSLLRRTRRAAPDCSEQHKEEPSKALASKDFGMIANALFITIASLLALGFWIMGELKFFIPYKRLLFHEYGPAMLIYIAVLFANLFAATLALIRKFLLKDTGRKLSHLDKQLHIGETEVPGPWFEEETD
jgi:hypothetical protein